jgi:hypothetical protein
MEGGLTIAAMTTLLEVLKIAIVPGSRRVFARPDGIHPDD